MYALCVCMIAWKLIQKTDFSMKNGSKIHFSIHFYNRSKKWIENVNFRSISKTDQKTDRKMVIFDPFLQQIENYIFDPFLERIENAIFDPF